MTAVRKRDDIVDNVKVFEGYLKSSKKAEKDFAVKLLIEAPALVVYKVDGVNHFAPSSFVAYKNNSMEDYLKTEDELREIAGIMTKIVGLAFTNSTIVEKFGEYASGYAKSVPTVDRQYWRIKDERRKNLDISL